MLRAGRALQVARCGYGAVLTVAPARLLRAATSAHVDERVALVARVLGVRNIAQAVLLGPAPGSTALRLGIAVDTLHAVSMLALAAVDPRVRGLALRSAGAAAGWGIASLVADRHDAHN